MTAHSVIIQRHNTHTYGKAANSTDGQLNETTKALVRMSIHSNTVSSDVHSSKLLTTTCATAANSYFTDAHPRHWIISSHASLQRVIIMMTYTCTKRPAALTANWTVLYCTAGISCSTTSTTVTSDELADHGKQQVTLHHDTDKELTL